MRYFPCSVSFLACLLAASAHAQSLTQPPAWAFPSETESGWYLGTEAAGWGVSKKTGQVAGGWNAGRRQRCLEWARNRYHVEDLRGLVTGSEDDDTVEHAAWDRAAQTLSLTCVNPTLPELGIRKEYRLEGPRLFKRTALQWNGGPKTFVTFNSEAVLVPEFRREGYYLGAGFVGPLVPAPTLTKWQKITRYKSTSKGMLLDQPREGYGLAHVRSALDGHFVWPWFSGAINGYVEEKNALSYTPEGWDFSLGTSPLSSASAAVFEEYFRIVPGNWFRWLAEVYPGQPEVAAEAARIPAPPEWVGDVKACLGFGDEGLARVERIVQSTDEGQVLVLLSGFGSWADYDVEGGLEGGEGGRISGPELRDLVRRIKAVSPRVRVGLYQWLVSCMPSARIYARHPEWFRTRDKAGAAQSTFPGFEVSYASMLSRPECYAELLRQCDRVLDYLGTDFVYLDDPKALNMVNWHTGDYTRDDLTYRFLLDVRKLVARHGADKMLFFNCRGNPYGDVNFVEARSQLAAGWWREFAGMGAGMEAFLAVRPRARIVPLYWTEPLARDYVNRVLALGWIPSLTYGSDVGRLPFARAAYEMGNCHQVDARYTPDWKTDARTGIESYLTQREGDPARILSLISHEKVGREVPVTMDVGGLGLRPGRPLWVWSYRAENPAGFQGTATERLVRANYRRAGWHLDRVLRRRLLWAGAPGQRLAVNVAMEPLNLDQLVITTVPAAVYSEDDLPNQYLFATTKRVQIRDQSSGSGCRLGVVCERQQAEIILFVDESADVAATLDGRPVRPDWVAEGGRVFPVFAVAKGRHELCVDVAKRRSAAPELGGLSVAPKRDRLAVQLSGCRQAVFSLEQDGRTLFGRAVGKGDGEFRIPYPDLCAAGTFRLACRGVVDDRGAWAVAGPAAEVTLPKRSCALGIPSDRHARLPERLELKAVNKTIRGVEVLQTAQFTSSTPIMDQQPELPMLEAHADAERLCLRAGTTRNVLAHFGAAFAGLEIKGLRQVKLKLENSYCSATHLRGKGRHEAQYRRSDSAFGGLVVDYGTAKGYTHRVGFAVGLLAAKCTCRAPAYGKNGPMDAVVDLGPIVDEGPEKTLVIDVANHAPNGWDGRVWLSVGSDSAAPDRRLTATVLAGNGAAGAMELR